MSGAGVPRVYALGQSALSGLVVHSLAKLPLQPQVPEIVSLLPSEDQLRRFLNNNSTVKLTQYSDRHTFSSTTTQLLSACRPPVYSDGSFATIKELVLSLANPRDIMGLQTYRPCLKPTSNILLLNGDKAVTDYALKKVWADPLERPNIYQCLSDFRVWNQGAYSTGLLGEGSLKITKLPRFNNDEKEYNYNLGENFQRTGDLIKMISETDILNPTFVSYHDFALAQAEYLIVRTSIGSLSSLYDCTSEELLHMKKVSNLLLKMIKELLMVIKKDTHLYSKDQPHAITSLSEDRLLHVVLETLKKDGKQSSAMRQNFNICSVREVTNLLEYFMIQASKHKLYVPNISLMRNLLLSKASLNSSRTLSEDVKGDYDIEFDL